jgi:exodeoxyribonuclease-3
MQIISWNIDSLNAVLVGHSERAELSRQTLNKIAELQPDIIGLQETKLSTLLPKHTAKLQEYFPEYTFVYTNSQKKKGYAGTLILYKNSYQGKPILDLDTLEEGRITGIEIDSTVYLSVYVPIGRSTERREQRVNWTADLRKALKQYHQQGKQVILFGDFNRPATRLDIYEPKKFDMMVKRFPPVVRDSFTNFFKDGYVDAFRYLYPNKDDVFTWWSQRNKTTKPNNHGWRLDYFLVDHDLIQQIKDVTVIDTGKRADHAPIRLELNN